MADTNKGSTYKGYDSSDIYLQGEYESFSYNRPMGGFKPKFEGVPDDYYPASWGDIVLMVLFVVFVVLGSLGIMIGFLYWEMASGISSFVLVWTMVLIGFMVIIFIGIFVGGRARIKNERVMIQQKLAE